MPKEFPNKDKIEFKQKFVDRYSKLTDFSEFKKYSLSFLRRSIRVNTLKISVDEVVKRLEKEWKLEPIPWCKEGFWISSERRDVGNLPEHVLGYIYIQEAASMIPPLVLDPKPGDLVLDMCAAPGSKSSQIGALMENKGVLVSNDVKANRLKPLGINMQKCGVTNCIITMMQGRWFKDLLFDKVLVDAPCSGTGTVRTSVKTLLMWNPNMVRRLAGMQRQLIDTGYNVLKPGGTLVYSTCSLEPEEDEAIIDYVLAKHPDLELQDIELNINRSPAVLEFEGEKYNPEVRKCLRIWPQDNDTEGFFVAKLRKKE